MAFGLDQQKIPRQFARTEDSRLVPDTTKIKSCHSLLKGQMSPTLVNLAGKGLDHPGRGCPHRTGSPPQSPGEPGRVAQLRLRHALQLWQEHHPGCRVLLTGGQRPGTPTSEARAMARWSLEWAAANWGPEAQTGWKPA